jgi:hypothetical protein
MVIYPVFIAKLVFAVAIVALIVTWTWWFFSNYGKPKMGPIILMILGVIFLSGGIYWHYYNTNLARGLELKIDGMVIMGVNIHSTELQITVGVVNHGQATTAHRWKLVVKTSNGDWETKYMPGEKPAKDSLNVPPLDEVLRHPLGTNDETFGLLHFLLPQISQFTVEGLKDDPKATLSLSVLDSTNHERITERSISEMSKERFEHHPSK